MWGGDGENGSGGEGEVPNGTKNFLEVLVGDSLVGGGSAIVEVGYVSDCVIAGGV
jgi:hypothetical protein